MSVSACVAGRGLRVAQTNVQLAHLLFVDRARRAGQQALRALPLARAFENGVFFALCDAFTPQTLSESYLCHPQGIRQSIMHQEGLIACEVDRAELAALRHYYGYTAQEQNA